MTVSWIERAKLFKSPTRVVAGFLLRSRETQAAQKRYWRRECQTQKAELQRQARKIEEQCRDISQLKRRVEQLQCEVGEAAKARPVLPSDPHLKGHGFGPRMICLAISLAQAVGFRAAARVMKIFSLG